MTKRQAFAQFLARYVRQFAQWLDPLPDQITGLHDAITKTRAALAASLDDAAHAQDRHFIEAADLREQINRTNDALVALQREHATCIPVPHDELYVAAVQLTAELEHREASGAWKRHHVAGLLQDAHPDRSGRDISLAIEAALWR